jgi:hypothetical protein
MGKKYEDFVLPNQEALWIQGLPIQTDYGFMKPIKIKSYSRFAGDFEFLKMQGFEIKDIIKKQCRGSSTEEFVISAIENVSFLELVRTNFWSLRDRYYSVFSRFIEDFDLKNFETMKQIEFDGLRELILNFNGVKYYRKSQDKKLERFNMMEIALKRAKSAGGIEFDAVYALLMTREGGGHKPHDINDFTILQFYSAFNSIQNQKNHDATILFKTVDPKTEIVEYFKTIRDKGEDGIVYKNMDELKNSKNAPIKL